ncbi:uncharacterized protein PRCAT00005343001 [Priceomyces carsonii]|uniref:uncharacterized protein n=1 Tax=Priceomyces carsonii TaxID=28549 RepID=UPI002ED947C6|nr:unnamed protein product [Priceomyces carsonii]
MANVSPSSGKVDDFLTSLSELSQQRLKEDQERQRRLQRNVDELRLNLAKNSPVKRSREQNTPVSPASGFSGSYTNVGGQEQREEKIGNKVLAINRSNGNENGIDSSSEEVGSKKIPPAKPTKSDYLISNPSGFSINLVQPVARKPNVLSSEYIKPKPKPTPTKQISLGSKQHQSFADIETSIKSGRILSNALGLDPELGKEGSRPRLPTRPSERVEDDDEKKPRLPTRPTEYSSNSEPDSGPPLPIRPKNVDDEKKPLLPQRPSHLFSSNLPNSSKNFKASSELKPIRPSKPSSIQPLKINVDRPKRSEDKPEFLVQIETMKNLRPNSGTSSQLHEKKPLISDKKPKPAILTFAERDNEILLRAKMNLSSKKPPPKPLKASLKPYEENDAKELLDQKNKLGKSEDAKNNRIEQRSDETSGSLNSSRAPDHALSKGSRIPTNYSLLKVQTEPKVGPETSIHDRLSSILRAGTAPELASSTRKTPAVAKSDPTPLKETRELVHVNKSRSKGPKRRLPKSMKPSSLNDTTININQTINEEEHLTVPKKNKKVPPPVNKATKPNRADIKPRVFSGEVFI